jgi:hypothetical protein
MNNYQKLDEIASLKNKLAKLQKQSNVLKASFFDYIEGLNSQLNVISNLNREDSSFEVFGNTLKLKSTYENSNDSFMGKFSIMIQLFSNGLVVFEEFYFINFDIHGNLKFPDDKNVNCFHDHFGESFYIGMMNKLIDLNKFEL